MTLPIQKAFLSQLLLKLRILLLHTLMNKGSVSLIDSRFRHHNQFEWFSIENFDCYIRVIIQSTQISDFFLQ